MGKNKGKGSAQNDPPAKNESPAKQKQDQPAKPPAPQKAAVPAPQPQTSSKKADKKGDGQSKAPNTAAPTKQDPVKNKGPQKTEASPSKKDEKKADLPSPPVQVNREESPEPVSRADKRKGNKGRQERNNNSSEASPKRPKEQDDYVSKSGFQHWLQENWKVALIVTASLLLLTVVKLKEDSFNRLRMNSAEVATSDLYEALGITSSAQLDDIKKAYKLKAAELHPDKNPECENCAEKFNLVTKAYETLSNPDTRKYYDSTNSILDPLKSATHQLTLNNFHRLVEESSDVWIIMVYLDTDDLSSQFTNFWDEVAKDYPFIQFGRINFASQAKLVSMLPFRVEEIPFVLSFVPGADSEFFEFDANTDIGPQLRKFVKDSIERKYSEQPVEEIKKILAAPTSSRPAVVQVTRNFTPLSFTYLSYKFSKFADFYVSKNGDHKRLYSYLDQNYVDYIVKLPEGLDIKGKKQVTFRFGTESKPPKDSDHLAVFPFIKFLSIPELRRSSFNEYCTDYTTSEDTEAIKPSVCIVALQSSGSSEGYERFLHLFRNEQLSYLPTFYQKTAEKSSDIFDAVKSVQFAWINADANKKFKAMVEEKVTIKNPRAFIYVSAVNKIKFYNDVDSLADDIEEVVKGSYPAVRLSHPVQPSRRTAAWRRAVQRTASPR